MSLKRHPEERDESERNSDEDKRRRLPTLENVVLEVMRIQSVQHLFEPILEPLIRKVVKEEVELALRKHLNSVTLNCGKQVQTLESRSLQLQFALNLSLPVFTGARIEGEECCNLKVALVDALNGKIVNSGHESSAKVEIVVLEGDFDGDNWTLEEFNNNIVREREGKKPLITGDAFFSLTDGIGSVGEISFTDNSSWTRSRKFRLGARILHNSDGIRVREAKTEPFIVRDHRGELYKKHHPPSLFDEVWRLEKIGKDGAFHKRLSQENVSTVKDFLTLLSIDPPRLRNILGMGMSPKMWETTVEHARTCVLDKRIYLFSPPIMPQKTSVVFNIVGQLLGLISEGQYVLADKLSESEKAESQKLVISAFAHRGEVVSFDNEASLTGGSSHIMNAPYSSNSPRLASQMIGEFDYTPQPSISSPDILSPIFSMADLCSLDDLPLHNIDSLDHRYDETLNYPNQVTNSIIDTESMTQIFSDNGDHLQFLDPDHSLQSENPCFALQADLHKAVNSFLLARSVDKAQRRWTKLFSVLKWFSIRRIVSTRRRTKVCDIQTFGNRP